MFIRKCAIFCLCLPVLAQAQEPELFISVLNPVHNVVSMYEAKTGLTMIGVFNQPVGGYQKISVYAGFPDKASAPMDQLGIVMQTIDDQKTDRPAQMPVTLTIDGVKAPPVLLQKSRTEQTTQRVNDLTVTPAVEKDVPIFVTVYWGTMPFSTLEQWANAKAYDLEFNGSHLASRWLTLATLKSIRAAVKAEATMFASNQLIPYRVNGKYGFTDTHGRLVIPARFDFAGSFHEDLARVAVDDPQAASGEGGVHRRYGYIDTTGKEVIPMKYSGASNFLGGVAQVVPLQGGNTLMIDKMGQMPTVGPNSLGWKFAVNDGSKGWSTWTQEDMVMSAVQQAGNGPWKYGFWNMQGKIVVPAKYDYATFYTNGKASLRDGKDWLVADKSGNLQKMGRPSGVTVVDGYSDNGMALVKQDNTCKDPVKAWSKTSAPILERLCIDAYGFADASGRLVIPPVYAKATQFSEGLAAAGKPVNCQKDRCNIRYTYVDASGKEIMPTSFARAEPFHGGLAAVVLSQDAEDPAASELAFAKTGGYAYIDHGGPGPTSIYPEEISTLCAGKTPCEQTLGPFEDNIAVITAKLGTGTLTYRIDRAGRIYWDGK